ncbi:DUF995 domain-containing protein [Microvirga sp. TS319]|uniref:DUF995 domain-containing protein n=1 Tax=Microvirga sp. TS319 TaxID=3241165 RepID=UPI00351AAAAB
MGRASIAGGRSPIEPSKPNVTTPASGERAMTSSELQQMYGGKTWMWTDGGGYFDPSGSFYGAVGNSPATAYLARGRWATSDRGALCFQALWAGQSGKNAEETCFYHKVANGRILQRKGQDGEWYTFKSPRVGPKDEFRKVITGNRIGDKMTHLRSKYLYGLAM